jgi:predicted MPP superfamily phosphohydrolase
VKKTTVFSVLISGMLLALVIYGIWVEPYWLDVKHLQVDHPTFSKVLRGKTAIQISDLHIGKPGKREERLLKLIEEIHPELIFLTGDYVTWEGDYEPALAFLAGLKAELGVWAVMGDYDYSNSRKSCVLRHEPGTGKHTRRHKVRFLRNSFERIDLQDGAIMVGGIDGEFERAFNSGDKLFTGKKMFPSIILSHSPLSFDALSEDGEVLMLSGDTHGGQIPLPSWLWTIFGYEKNAKYNQGW